MNERPSSADPRAIVSPPLTGPMLPVAVVGMAGRFPAAADIHELWGNLLAGRQAVTAVPAERWPRASAALGGSPEKFHGAFIADADCFDAAFFRLSHKEAELMDPQQRLLLETAWHTLEDARIKPSSLAGQPVGVFVGVCNTDYAELLSSPQRATAGLYASTGGAPAILANRLSFFFDFRGPSIALDTACSSSLTAVHMAVQAIQNGECTAALAAGANICWTANRFLAFDQAGMLAADGRCKTFDAGADGYVRGEGVCAVLLKPLSRALEEGDRIHGVIRASAVSHGGRTNGLTVTSHERQRELLISVYRRAGIAPQTVGYVEAHGTGTSLGDPIEFLALKQAFAELGADDSGHCALGSIKTHIGHLEGAAGIAGLMHALLAIRHRTLPANPNLRSVNPLIDLNGTPFHIPTKPEPWSAPSDRGPRRAGVSSFGYGGAYAHVVLEEYQNVVAAEAPRNGPCVLCLSARNDERLRRWAGTLADFLASRVAEPTFSLSGIAYSLQRTREEFEERAALIAESVDEACEKLRALASSADGGVPGCWRGRVSRKASAPSAEAHGAGLRERTAESWVNGAQVNWEELYDGKRPALVTLPGYPFVRRRYWMPELAEVATARPISQALSGTESFLRDHVVAGTPIMPAVAYLEMALTAARTRIGGRVELKNVTWLQPLSIEAPREVHVELRERGRELEFEIYTADGEQARVVHAQGRAVANESAAAPARVDIAAARKLCDRTLDIERCYAAFAASGLRYGPAFRGLSAVHSGRRASGESFALARVALPECVRETCANYTLHPSLLDGALQASIGAVAGGEGTALELPFALERLEIFATPGLETWVHVVQSAPSGKLTIELCDAEGTVQVRLQGYSTRPAQSNGEHATILFGRRWEAPPAAPSASEYAAHCVLVDAALAELLPVLRELRPQVQWAALPEAAGSSAVAMERSSEFVLHFVQTLLTKYPAQPLLLQIASGRNARAWSGLLKSVAQEHSKFRGQMIELPAALSAAELARVIEENAGTAVQAAEVRYESGVREVARFRELDASKSEIPWKRGGVYLITGGAGGLGRLLAREIAVRTPSATVILAGRSELDETARAELQALAEGTSARVEYRVADVADAEAAQRCVDSVMADYGTLSGVVHCAGTYRDELIVNKRATELGAVLAPKVRGIVNLDEATRTVPLDFLILFSSISSALGNFGQSDYAVANGFLDDFAAARNVAAGRGERHGRTASINWPLWAEGGMRVAAATLEWSRRRGLHALGSEAGVRTLYAAWASGETQVLVLSGERKKIEQLVAGAQSEVRALPAAAKAIVAADGLTLEEKIRNALIEEISRQMSVSRHDVDPDAEFAEFGFDSISLTVLGNRLNEVYGFELTPTIFFEYPTIGAFARHLLELHGQAPAQEFQTSAVPDARETSREPIAIVGVSGRFPGAANVVELWSALAAGKDCITEVPASRWDWRALCGDPEQPNTTNVKWGGFIEGIEEFDPLFFGISPREAELMDPQQRLLLMHSYQAIEDAGYSPERLAGSRTGIFVGVGASGYAERALQANRPIESYSSTGAVSSIAPNRISYWFDFRGPSEPIDTACSSSLVAIHRAVRAMRAGECDMALVGGVNLLINPWLHVSFSKAGMLAPDGRCKTFSKDANGYVRAEGVGMLFLKKLSDAERDGDHVYALVRGSSENHGGRASSLTAPNPKAQAELIQAAHRDAGVDAHSVTYVEAHGTGTSLGDPIEVDALKSAFSPADAAGYCGLGSIKTNIGHLELAAGVAGVIKVLLQLQHRTLAKSLHCEQPNPYLKLAGTPFYLVDATRPWAALRGTDGAELPRRAGVSSFGFGGANAHVLIEEYIEPPRGAVAAVPPPHPALIVLSAKDQERLRARAGDLLEHLRARETQVDLYDLAYTLQVGRDALEQRLAFTAATLEETVQKLSAFVEESRLPDGGFEGDSKKNKEALAAFGVDDDLKTAVSAWIDKGKHARVLELWAKGFSFDWSQLYRPGAIYGGRQHRRLALPTYRFATERHWIDGEAPPPLKSDLPERAAEPSPLVRARRRELEGLSVRECVAWELGELASELLKLPRRKLDATENLADFGFDSIGLAAFAKRLSSLYELELAPSIFFTHATLQSLAQYLCGAHLDRMRAHYGDAPVSTRVSQPRLAAVAHRDAFVRAKNTANDVDALEPIAIVGMSGRFPQAQSIEEMWRVMREGRDTIGEIPLERFDSRPLFESGKISSKWLGALSGVEEFDPLFFEIAPKEAALMDPRQRLLLEESFKALEDAGGATDGLRTRRVGMFVGTEQGDYQSLIAGADDEASITANHDAFVAARLSYFLDLRGPALALNTACSSGLVALHQACMSLRAGECEAAVAAAVNLILTPQAYVRMSHAGMLSSDGKCYAFDRRANGMVPGEAVVALVLKPLSQAVAQGDFIYATIRASGINYDGKTNGVTAPNGAAQAELIRDVHARAAVSPASIEYLVAHGTGTRLGDPVEINALQEAFGASAAEAPTCALTSPKTNFGHTFAASGLVSVANLVMAMRYETIPASLHCDQLSDYIDWARSPFYVNTRNRPWPRSSLQSRLGAVSAFGMSGTNAHVVIESYESRESLDARRFEAPCHLIAVSAKTEAALRERIQGLVEMLRDPERTWQGDELAALSHTTLARCQHFTHRCAVIAQDREHALELLEKASSGESLPTIFSGKVPREFAEQPALAACAQELIAGLPERASQPVAYRESLAALADLHCRGYRLDWPAMYGPCAPARVPLPPYPFARERHWAATPARVADSVAPVERAPVNAVEPLCFSEEWEPRELDSGGRSRLRSVAIFLADRERQRELGAALAKIDPSLVVTFAVRGAEAEISSSTEAIWMLWPLEQARGLEDHGAIGELLRGLAHRGLKRARVLMAGSYANALERCHLESWIGYERSIGRVVPGLELAVIHEEAAAHGETPFDVSRWARRLWDESQAGRFESALYLGQRRHVLRTRPLALSGGSESALREGGVYWITGGLGGIAYSFAQHLARRYRAKLLLTGRSPLDGAGRERLDVLERLGARAMHVQADVADPIGMRAALERGREAFGSVHGVIHAAGVAGSATILEQDAESARAVMSPKIAGTTVLAELLENEPVDFICHCSSLAASLGDFGSCDYAVANRFQLAHAKYASRVEIALCWPLWADGGMKLDDAATQLYLRSSGQQALSVAQGIDMLEQALAGRSAAKSSHAIVLVGEAQRIQRLMGLEPSAAPSPARVTSRRAELQGLGLRECVEWELKEIVGELLDVPLEKLEVDANLAEFGFDSLGLARFARRLSEHYGIEVLPSVFFDRPTLEALTRYFVGEWNAAIVSHYGGTANAASRLAAREAVAARVETTAASTEPSSTVEPVAIVGMSGRFPGARSIDELWQLLLTGQNAVREIANGRWLGALPGAHEFDAPFFEISPREAELMDPRQRLLLEESFKALEDAGFGGAQLSAHKIGMFVGVEQGDYEPPRGVASSLTANHEAILASRLAYFLNLRGPVLAINTACSSGLVALHQACLALRAGECDAAIVASVNLMLAPESYAVLSEAGMLSPDGKCHAFDRRANGIVPGEAVVAVVLKRLRSAEQDGDSIHATIRASGINYDGRTNGMTAPSGVAQRALLEDVYARGGVNPRDIGYVVTHGTGTRLGDPIEINALREVFPASETAEPYCALTSPKTNLGHTFAASGLVNLIALVRALQAETIPPSLHCEEPSDYIDWRKSPFYVNTLAQPWARKVGNRLGAVSAFGMSGTNAHAVVEGYETPAIVTVESKPAYLVALSAKTETALRQRAADLLAAVRDGLDASALGAVSHTLLGHRQHFDHRCACVVASIEQLARVLEKIKEGETAPALIAGVVARDFVERPMLREYANGIVAELGGLEADAERYGQALLSIGELYCQGYELEWRNLQGTSAPRRVRLPTYPFTHRTYERGAQVETQVSVREERPPMEHSSHRVTLSTLSMSDTPPPAAQKETQSVPLPRPEILEEELRASLAAALYMETAEVDVERPFMELGLDSIIGVEWVRTINKTYALALGATKLYEHPTIRELAAWIHELLPRSLSASGDEPSPESPAVADEIRAVPAVENTAYLIGTRGAQSSAVNQSAAVKPKPDAIAIVGMSGRYPGAPDLAAFWDNLQAGRNCITEIPPSRWNVSDYYSPRVGEPGTVYCKWLGSVADIDCFDPLFFNISPAEAQAMDPQQRLFLEEAYKAFEHAGYAGHDLSGRKCGVYLGMTHGEYDALLRQQARAPADITGSSAAIAAARIAYHLNLKGPAIPVDTACSSSLVATHLACQALRTGEIDMALVGGVTLYLAPEAYIGMCAAGMLSPEGQCRAFDNGANGFVPADGVGTLVLKRLADAEAAGDRIHGVIVASGINQDGKTNGITAPSLGSQVALLRDTYARYGIDPETIGYIETHGTGTKLGDPIELEALAAVFAERTNRRGYCAIGSVKSNVGHTSAAAGVAGMHKTLLALERRTLVPTLNFATPNEHFDFAASPFVVNTELRPWPSPAGMPRRAAVSSFGFSGTNAHVVVEEYTAPAYEHADGSSDHPVLIALSARTAEQLEQQASRLYAYLQQRRPSARELVDIAFTLQVGRDALEYRCATVVHESDRLTNALRAFLAGESGEMLSGRARKDKSGVPAAAEVNARVRSGDLPALAQAWVRGAAVEWKHLYASDSPLEYPRPKRVPLPTYPFAKERYWIDALATASAPIAIETAVSPSSLAFADTSSLTAKTRAALIDAISRQLRLKLEDIDVDAELGDFGFDSIRLTELGAGLNRSYGLALDPPIFFEHPTVRRLAAFLVKEHRASLTDAFGLSTVAGEAAPVASRVERHPARLPVAATPAANDPIAIVGVSGCFPGAADVEAFWENLAAGKDCITEIPADRWDWRALWGDPKSEPNRTNVKWGGFIDGVDTFDPLFFGISPQEAELMDPQQRLLMLHTWQAIEDAGYGAYSLAGTRTGIFAGTINSGYGDLITAAGVPIEGYTATGAVCSVGPNRMSYFLDLHGPSEPIETACSSSLVAIHRAVQALRHGECDYALAGGINTIVTPVAHISFSKAGMLSEDGRCKTFSKNANGYARGEGAGMLFLKKLSDAEHDRDHIYAVIRGTAENHGGKANSLTAPNPGAQAELIKSAHRAAGIDPRTVTYIEAHGTGTPLGDPVEINGLKSAFADLYAEHAGDEPIPEARCGIGSLKTNIGHLEIAAGVAGVIKVLLQFRHRTLAKSLHSEELNPYIQLAGSPFYIVQETQPWEALRDREGHELPRRAGVSSFGFGGVNAHVVCEEYVRPPEAPRDSSPTPQRPAIVVLSARTEERLKEYAARLLAHVAGAGYTDSDLYDIAYTLQVGREPLEHRLALTAASLADMRATLQRYLDGRREVGESLHVGQVRREKELTALFADDAELAEAVGKWIERGKFPKLLSLWAKGLSVDWRLLYEPGAVLAGVVPRRLSLPTYPFAKLRCWVEKAPAVRAPPAPRAAPAKAFDSGALGKLLDELAGQRISVDDALERVAR